MKRGRADRANSARKHPEPLGNAMQALFQHLGIAKKVQQYSVINSWEAIVGEKIASVSTARRIENGILFVDVKTGAWRTELVMRKMEILGRIHKMIGKKILKDIRFH